MPIYEYYCGKCRKKMSFLVMSPASFRPSCKYCGGENLERLFSRFATPKSEESRLESLADPSSFSGLDENDPSSVARWMKKMGKELGEDFGGEDIDQLAEEAAQEAAGGGEAGEPGGSSSEDL
jgi:putative FmdB family regulatory protein